jgi:hypothetical protein
MFLGRTTWAFERSRNDDQIVSDDTLTKPAFHTRLVTIQARIRATRAPQMTDASFDTGVPAAYRFEPGLLFQALPYASLGTRLGKTTRFTPRSLAACSSLGE